MNYRRSATLMALIAFLALVSQAAFAAEPIRVMTFNIRYGTAPDGENAWPKRRDLVVKVIKEADPDVIGLQEALREQLDFLQNELPEYAKVGVGRDANGGGEYSAILYRAGRFDLSDAGTFWLSATPEKPGSHTWGNTLPRIVTWARLLDRATKRRFVMANTHWDHQSQPAREQGAQLMADRLCEVAKDGEPLVATGDFNAGPQNPAFVKLLEAGKLKDTYRLKHPDEKKVSTFNGFGTKLNGTKIDAVLINAPWQVKDAKIIRTHEGERYPSDHFPLTATIALKD
jgi:endonuclease/exonuclease/phosphatase family metal-dependent hydrolase